MNNIFLLGIGILLASFRIIIEHCGNLDIVLVMAVINIVAFNYVFLLIGQSTIVNISKHLNDSFLSVETQKKALKKAQIIISMICVVLFLVFSLLYIFLFQSAVGNDILSIMALVFSICSDSLSKYFAEKLYNSHFI